MRSEKIAALAIRAEIKQQRLANTAIEAFRRKGKDTVLIEFVRYKIENDIHWLEQTLRLIYGNQTKDEQQLQKTIWLNLKGFSKPDADRIYDYIVEYILLGKNLTGKSKSALQNILPKYAKQLFKRFPEIQALAETELSNPITRGKFDVPGHLDIQDKGTSRGGLGEDPKLIKKDKYFIGKARRS